MPGEKSLWFYGKVYQKVFDPAHEEAREVISGLVSERSSVLDVGCGTGTLAFKLRSKKRCKVIGVDLSQKMIDFADKQNRYTDVIFEQRDATDLKQYKDKYFDYAITCKMIHELLPDTRRLVINELFRLGKMVIIFDYLAPLPGNIRGKISKLIEQTIGRDHVENFKNYQAINGLQGILNQMGIASTISQSIALKNGCEQIIVLKT